MHVEFEYISFLETNFQFILHVAEHASDKSSEKGKQFWYVPVNVLAQPAVNLFLRHMQSLIHREKEREKEREREKKLFSPPYLKVSFCFWSCSISHGKFVTLC